MESIGKVEEAEKRAKEIVEEAEADGRRLLDEAGSRAKEIAESSAKKCVERRAARISETVSRLEEENRKSAADAQKEAAKIRSRKVSKEALGRLSGKVADLILGE
jgi:vacuolar-type H+-ATPase subunit H